MPITFVDGEVPDASKFNAAFSERVLLSAQTMGVIGYDTLADLNANLNYPAQTGAIVQGDSTPANNGFYIKSGASGSGSWVIQAPSALSAEITRATTAEAAISATLTPIAGVLSVIASGVGIFGRTWLDAKGRLAGWIDNANNWTIVKLVALRASISALTITGGLTIGALVQSVATTSFLRSVVDLKGRLLMALQADGSILISKLRDGTNTDVYAKLATAYTAALAATPPSSYKAALSAAFPYGFFPTNMASPPTISTAVTTQTITGGTTTPWQSSFWRTLYGKYVQAGGNAYGQFLSANYSSTVNGPATASNNAAVEFMHTGTAFEIVVYGNGQPLTLFVGPDASTPRTLQRANTTAIANPNNTGQAVFIRVDFGSTSATRRIRIEGAGLVFGGVVCKAGETVSAVTDPKPPIVVWIGDSFVEGGTGTNLPGTGMTMHTARALGWDIWSSGVGGTGVIQPLAPRVNFQQRMADAYGVSNIQLLIFSNSINDSGQTQAALQAGIENCMTQFRAVCPTVPVIMTSIQTVNGTIPQNYFPLRDAAAQVAREFPGVYYLDRLIRNVMTGTGSIPYPPPSALAVTTSGTTGGPAAATYYYVVTAKDSIGETTASNEVSIASNGGPNALTWTAFGGLTYSVYRGTSAGGESVRLASGLTSAAFTDTGAATTSAAPPTVNTTGNKGDGNSDLYRNYDQTHPSPAGHQYRGLDDSNEIRGIVARIA